MPVLHWPYAVFSYLRDAYKTPNFHEWPKYATYDAKEIETLCRPDSADYPHIAIYYYIQFNLHRQLLVRTIPFLLYAEKSSNFCCLHGFSANNRAESEGAAIGHRFVPLSVPRSGAG